MTPGQLVKAVAIALDVPEETVVQHDRNLVVAGLRTKGGRGRSAPEVTPLDAARLLVATLASVRTKDSVGSVLIFESTKIHRSRTDMRQMIDELRARGGEVSDAMERSLLSPSREFSDPAIEALPQTHNFVEGLAALISAAAGPVDDLHDYLRRFAEIYVVCVSRFCRAEIGRMSQGSVSYQLTDRGKPSQLDRSDMPRYLQYVRYYGIFQKRDIYGSAIMLLGKAFRDNGLPFGTTNDALNALLGARKAKVKKKVA